MGKSLYSMILSDEVVDRIDKIAREEGSNRSAVINNILAEYVEYITPEKHIENVFDALKNYMEKGIEVLSCSKARTVAMRSTLQLKYRPSITYEVELYRADKNRIGELKINCRTGVEEVLEKLYLFIKKWVTMEENFIKQIFPQANIEYYVDGNKLRRIFQLMGNNDSDKNLSKIIGEYITLLDKSMKEFLYYDRFDLISIGNNYRKYLNNDTILI